MLSLHVRVFAAIALICAVALAGVGMYSTRVTFLQLEDAPGTPAASDRAAKVQTTLTRYARTHPRLEQVQPLLQNLARRFNARIVLVSADGHLVATSLAAGSSAQVTPAGAGSLRVSIRENGIADEFLLRGGLPVRARSGDVVAYFFTLSPALPPRTALGVARSSARAVWTAVVVAFLAALIVAVLLSRYIVGPVRDLTAAASGMARGNLKQRVRVKGSDDLARLGTSFNAMADAIERTEVLRRRMVSDVAHELRSPLTRMRAQLEAAQDGHMNAAEVLSAVYRETIALEHLVDDLRDLSLADAGKLHIEKTAVSLETCIDDGIARIRTAARERDVTIVRDVAPGVPAITGDPARTRQILANLLDNALRYAQRGGHIVVGAAVAEHFSEFFVQDDGPGIDASNARSIFERFYRVDGSRARGTGGSGLGLAIAKELTELQGGSIAVESTVGEGSRFTCRFPHA